MSALDYPTFVSNLANMLVVSTTDAGYQTALNDIINDAEQRIYRDLDLLNTVTRDSSAALTSGLRTFDLPSVNGTFVVTEEINVITPAGTSPDNGTRVSLVPVAKEVLDFLYPNSTGASAPAYFAPLTQATILVGPWPDANYIVEVVGTIRPASLSGSNTTSLLSVYFPDLFFAASMVFGAAYQKNFGSSSDDPKMAQSWEGHYQTLLQSAKTEEQRKKFASQGWSEKEPAPLATPPRS